jgi:erythromycin esterase-like protein
MELINLTDTEKTNLDKQVSNIENVVNEELITICNSISNDNEILLLGECTHGTREFYETRFEITKHMIINHSYKFVLLEAEWPDIIRINDYIQGRGFDKSAEESLLNIRRFPKWMWNNKIVINLINWLRDYNNNHPKEMVYILGMDCQQFLRSMKYILDYLKIHNSSFFENVNTSLAIFRQFITEGQYAANIVYGPLKNCVHIIIKKLQELLSTFQWDHVDSFLNDPNISIKDKIDRISCEQSFEILVNGEEYFRKMLEEPSGSQASWNTRDQHMLMTIMRIRNRFSQINNEITPKIIVWAHNSHLGNSLATSRGGNTFANNNTWNVGQMVKEMFPKSKSIGFYTYEGTVTAAEKDSREGIKQTLNKAHPLSYEYLFHKVCINNNINQFWLDLSLYKNNNSSNKNEVRLNEEYRDIYTGDIFTAKNVITGENKLIYLVDSNNKKYLFINPYSTITKRCRLLNSFGYNDNTELFNSNLLQRWVGVNYVKETELDSHYGESKLAVQYDYIIFNDKTEEIN